MENEQVCLQENTDKNPGDMRTVQTESIEKEKGWGRQKEEEMAAKHEREWQIGQC